MTCANLAVLARRAGTRRGGGNAGPPVAGILESVLGPEDAEVGLTLLNLGALVAGRGPAAEGAELASRARGHPGRAASGRASARAGRGPRPWQQPRRARA